MAPDESLAPGPGATRAPAVAGLFYPAEPARLRAEVARCLAAAGPGAGPAPRALVVPHAGYRYSGPVAAAAYAQLRPGTVRRVVLIGPAHRVAFRGLAVPGAAAFASPLGAVPLDRAGLAAVVAHRAVRVLDAAHADEHSLEVQLPFLQVALGDFTLLPLLAGDVSPADVADVLELAWDGPRTLVVVSTDLSHYHRQAEARARDAATCRRIAALDATLAGEEACGCAGLNGFLLVARRRGLVPRLLDLRNSADTGGDAAGDAGRVVGYAAFAFDEPHDAGR